jgi:hypothetical protein
MADQQDLTPVVAAISNAEGMNVDGPTVMAVLLGAVSGLYEAANSGLPAVKEKQPVVIPFSAHGVPMRG